MRQSGHYQECIWLCNSNASNASNANNASNASKQVAQEEKKGPRGPVYVYADAYACSIPRSRVLSSTIAPAPEVAFVSRTGNCS